MEKFLPEAIPFWNELTDSQRKIVFDNAVCKNVSKNTIVYNAHDSNMGLKLVYSGQIRMFISTEQGDEITIFRLTRGDICLLSALDNAGINNVSINLESEKDSVICHIPETVYSRINSENIAVNNYTQDILANRIQKIMSRIAELMFFDVGTRLADALICHSYLNDSTSLNITHEILSKDVGTAREVVSRLLKEFERDNLIKMSRGKIKITNMEKLKEKLRHI